MKFIRYQRSPLLPVTSRFSPKLDQLLGLAFPELTGYACATTRENEIPLDLYQTQEALVLQAELPGYTRENITVAVADNRLTLTVQPQTETADSAQEKAPQETPCSRSLRLPQQVNVEKIQARYENGLLTVTLPKQEETKPKSISIEVS